MQSRPNFMQRLLRASIRKRSPLNSAKRCLKRTIVRASKAWKKLDLKEKSNALNVKEAVERTSFLQLLFLHDRWLKKWRILSRWHGCCIMKWKIYKKRYRYRWKRPLLMVYLHVSPMNFLDNHTRFGRYSCNMGIATV